MGKTTLGLAIAHEIAADFPDGQYFEELGNGDAERGIRALKARMVEDALKATGDEMRSGDIESTFIRVVRGRRTLVLVDNVQNEILARQLLPLDDNSALIVIGRKRLSGLDNALLLEVPQMTSSESRNVIRSASGRDSDSNAALDQVADLCDRIPLALRIAGSLAGLRPQWSLEQIASEFEDERERLNLLEAGDLAVRTAFAVAVAELKEAEARIFRALSALPSSTFSPGLVSATDGMSAGMATRGLLKLTEVGLVTPDQAGAFRIHDLLRLFSEELAAAVDGQKVIAVRRIASINWLFRGADDAASSFRRELDDTRREEGWFEIHLSALLGAITVAINLNQLHPALSAIDNLSTYLAVSRKWQLLEVTGRRGIRLIRSIRSDKQVKDDSEIRELDIAEAIHAGNVAQALIEMSAPEEALKYIGWGRKVAVDYFGPFLAARFAELEGHSRSALGDMDAALRQYERAFDFAIETEHPSIISTATYNVGLALHHLGKSDQALRYFNEELAEVRKRGDRRGEAITLNSLGLAMSRLARRREAVAMLRESVEIARSDGQLDVWADALHDLAKEYWALGELSEALRCAEQEYAYRRESGDEVGAAQTTILRVRLRRNVAHLSTAQAADEIEDALRVLNEPTTWRAEALIAKAELVESADEATALLLEAVSIGREAGDPFLRTAMLTNAAQRLREIGNERDAGLVLGLLSDLAGEGSSRPAVSRLLSSGT